MSVIKCSHCGKDLPDESKFCPYCMERINEPVPVKIPEAKKKLHKETIVLIIVTIVLSVLIAGIFVANSHKNKDDQKALINVSEVEGKASHEKSDNKEDAAEKDGTSSAEDVTQSDTADKTDAVTQKAASVSAGGNGSQKSSDKKTDSATEKAQNTSVGGNTPVITTTQKAVANNKEKTDAQSSGVTECQHNWVAITKTVYHDEEGHYEDVTKQRPVTKYECPVCYKVYDSINKYYNHFDNTHTPSYSGDPITIFREKYTTETEYENYTEKQWVIDKEAYNETVITGYECSRCGKTKEN